MRKQNSEFLTAFTSEAGNDIKNTDYFGFVELDDYACYVIADGIDDQYEAVSAKLAVSAAISAFLESPSMSRRVVKRCLNAANKALVEAKRRRRLKASVIIVLTDYVKMRYGQAGNIRLRLYRNGFLKQKTTDQSLTMDLVREEKVSLDKVAVHEERNNLYTYLGQKKGFQPYISKKIKLMDSDAVSLYTRGVWENIDEGELLDVFAEATFEPQQTVDNIEDMLLSGQPEDLQKYTLAVIFVNKTFNDPNRRRKIKKIILISVIAVFIAAVITVVLVAWHRKREAKREQMQNGYTDTIEYIQMNNYTRAKECCEETEELAESLKDEKMIKELADYTKLIEAVLTADEQLDNRRYSDALLSYQEAAKRSKYVDNVGLDYIEEHLERTTDYISVYELIALGDTLLANLQYDEAEEKYLEAKKLAAKLYFDEGRAASMEALEKLYEEQKKQKEAENEELKTRLEQEASGASYIAQGDTAYAKADYESARVYYTSALQKYVQLNDAAQVEAVEEKLKITEGKISDKEKLHKEAEEYIKLAEDAANGGDYYSAKKYYLLAKDVFATLKNEEKISEVTRKMEVLDLGWQTEE
ncbi:MAG: hypothetical protein ACI4AQ_06995 [Lachnospiraceae bacterium]